MATDFLDKKRSEIGARLNELRPLIDEYQRLEAAVAALDGVPANAAPSTAASHRKPARATTRATTRRQSESAGGGRRGRPKGSGTRGLEALELVKANPGITIPEIAQKMGIKQNYLYRVLPGLAQEGRVVKQGRGWLATESM